jgi:hypothetical protein
VIKRRQKTTLKKRIRFPSQPVFALSIIIFAFIPTFAQRSLTLTREQAVEDFKWLRFALEYSHPRLYKYDSKEIVDTRFDSLQNIINDTISAVDFLRLVNIANATVHCGHL